MLKKIKKWGNSLAVRIPKKEAEKLDLYKDREVEIKVEKEGLVISPKKNKLKELVDDIDEENIPGGFPEDNLKGKEIW